MPITGIAVFCVGARPRSRFMTFDACATALVGHASVLIRHPNVIDCSHKRNALFCEVRSFCCAHRHHFFCEGGGINSAVDDISGERL
jgi:hypothetical protein